MFLEYAHYLPERATLKVVEQIRGMVSSELESFDLKTPLNADAIVDCLSHVHSGSFCGRGTEGPNRKFIEETSHLPS